MLRQAMKQVFGDASYLALAAGSGFAIFVLTTWLPNMGLVWQIATSSTISIADKTNILAALVGSIGTNFTLFTASLSVAIAALFGTNLAMAAYVLRMRRHMTGYRWRTDGAAGLGGLVSGLFGIGCAACGSIAIAPVLSVMGAGGLIAALPFGGEEFSLLGVALLGLSFVLTARMIARQSVCAFQNDNAEPPQSRVIAFR